MRAGVEFPYTINDARVTMRVSSHIGGGVWRCKVSDCSIDYQGVERYLPESKIEEIIRFEDQMRGYSHQTSDWFSGLNDGEIIHLIHMKNQWVRCEVMGGSVTPIALVGDWKSYDLPKRRPDGGISLPHYPRMILAGETFRPNPANFWEFEMNGDDPSSLDPVSLEVPEMTPEEESTARFIRIRDEAIEMLNEEASKESFEKVAAFLTSVE